MQTKKIYMLFILVCILFGSTFLAISLGLKAGASPLFYAAIRFILAGTIMISALVVTRRSDLCAIRAIAGRSLVFSLFMTVGTFGCMFLAQTRVDSGFMARLDGTGPILTAVFAAILLRTRLSMAHFTAFALGTGGAFLMAGPANWAEPIYLVAAMGSVLLYAVGNVLYPLLFSNKDDPVLISALQSLMGGLILMGVAVPFETISFPLSALGPLAYLVIGGSVIGHTAALVLVRDAGPVFASAWLYVAPVTATILGVLVLDESVSASGVLGTILALAGVFVLGRIESGNQPVLEENKQNKSANMR